MSLLRTGQFYAVQTLEVESPETWLDIVCVKQKSFAINNKVIDGTSDCGPDYAPGFPNSTLDLAAYGAFQNPDADQISQIGVFDLAQSAESKTFRFYPIGTPATPAVTGDPIYTMTGFVSTYKNSMSTDENVTFEFTIQVQGNVTQTFLP